MINIKDKSNCCGCEACVQICPHECISFIQDEEGFYYPKVDADNCINCRLCEKVCPALNPFNSQEPQKVFAAINNDIEIRKESSSGGIFTLFANYIINIGGVVFGAKFDRNWQVVIDYTETTDGLSEFRGSKYVQARTERSFIQCEKFLKAGKTVLYSGTPCQIAGLLHFLPRKYENLYTLDVVCHGVPSPGVWKKYLRQLSKQNGIVSDIKFRAKEYGWQDYCFKVCFLSDKRNDVKVICTPHNEDIYMLAFLSNMTLRPSCYKCPVKRGRSMSDVSLADFWGIDHIMPNMNDDLGVSLVLLNSKKSMKLFDVLECKYEQLLYRQACEYNPTIMECAKPHHYRKHFFNEYILSDNMISLIYKEFYPGIFQKIKYLPRRIINLVKIFD